MGALGLLGPTIPEEYGGAGLGYVAYGLIAREIERVDSGYRSTAVGAVVAGDASDLRLRHRGAAEEVSAQARQGELIGCFGLTEPDFGSDPGSMVTRAEKVPAASSSTAPRCGSPTRRSPTSHRLGEARRQDPRLHRRARHQGLLDAEDRGQALPAHLGHRRDRAGGRRHAGGESAAERVGPRRSVRLPQHGALRHRLGRDGRRRVLLARGAAIRARPQAVRPAARRQSAGAEEARRHADRDRARASRRAARSAACWRPARRRRRRSR